MNKTRWMSYMVLLVSSFYLTPSSALVLTLESASGAAFSVNTGETFEVDVVASDLAGDVVTAFDYDIDFDPTIVNALSVDYGSSLGDPLFFESLPADFLDNTAGVADISNLSFLDVGSLAALQPGPTVTLATISFEAIGAGSADIDFANPDPFARLALGSHPFDPLDPGAADLLAATAYADASANTIPVSVTVVATPAPGVLVLMLTGLVGFRLFNRKS